MAQVEQMELQVLQEQTGLQEVVGLQELMVLAVKMGIFTQQHPPHQLQFQLYTQRQLI